MKVILLGDVKESNFSSGSDIWTMYEKAKVNDFPWINDYFV